jgi:hypothetical protein
MSLRGPTNKRKCQGKRIYLAWFRILNTDFTFPHTVQFSVNSLSRYKLMMKHEIYILLECDDSTTRKPMEHPHEIKYNIYCNGVKFLRFHPTK